MKKWVAILSACVMFMGVLGMSHSVQAQGLENLSKFTEETFEVQGDLKDSLTESSSDTSANKSLPVFLIQVSNSEGAFFKTAFYVRDTNGNTYFVTDGLVAYAMQQGYEVTAVNADGKEFNVQNCCASDDGFITFLVADEVAGYTPYEMIKECSDAKRNIIYWLYENEQFSLTSEETDMANFQKNSQGFYLGNKGLASPMWPGAPVLNSEFTHAWGIATTDGEDLQIIIDLNTINFVEEAAITTGNNSGGTQQEEPAQQQEEPAQQQEKPAQEQDSMMSTKAFVVIVFAVVVIVLLTKKSKKNKETSSTDYQEGTVALAVNSDVGKTEIVKPQPVKEMKPLYQIRGISGVFEGQVFGTGTAIYMGRNPECQVIYPSKTAGISGKHCKVEQDMDGIILRDLQSSYGTYYNGTQLQPQLDYHLKAGDQFYLGEKTQMFRVEKVGEYRQEYTPVVKAVVSPRAGMFYHANAEGKILFGRSNNAQVSFEENETSISTNHCVLYRNNEGLFLMDLGSMNGTFLNENRRLQPNVPCRMSKGSTFFLASPKYTFVITED